MKFHRSVKISRYSIVKKITIFRSKRHEISSVVKKDERRENLLKKGEYREKKVSVVKNQGREKFDVKIS